jgi:hypothetical protein
VLGLGPGTRDEALLTPHRPRGTSERPRCLVARHRERLVMVMEIVLTEAMIAANTVSTAGNEHVSRRVWSFRHNAGSGNEAEPAGRLRRRSSCTLRTSHSSAAFPPWHRFTFDGLDGAQGTAAGDHVPHSSF